MNQILLTNLKNHVKKYKNIKKLKILLFVSLALMLTSFLFYAYNYVKTIKDANLSTALLNSFNIERLYSKQKNSYTSITLNNNGDFFVIGSIEIPSIQINYPILSHTNDELLKIAPCRFYGPSPNKEGNLCIAAHNYDDNRFFGNLNKLNIGDKINIYDSSNSLISYYIYDKFETKDSDTSCTLQNTNGTKEITLVTCNNLNGNRLIVKARE